MKGLRPVVSIIIPTYKDWYRLALCLDRLNQQSWPKENFEVIVINNDPDEVAPDFLQDYLAENVTLLDEAKSGSYAARNTGIRHATGDIFGFTDSDCLPDKDWIAAAVDLFEKESCDRIGGNIEIFYEKEGRPTNAEIYEKVFAFKQAETVQASGVCVTGNMFSKRYVFDTVGLFNENLFSGGDYEWGKRAADQGFTIAYGEHVRIFHPARRNMDELLKKAKRVGGGTAHHLHGSKKRAIVDYLKTFEPSTYTFHMLRSYGKELTLYQKIKVFLLRRYIKHSMNLEKLKVVFGKTANRQ
ncbi:glycosyltransferase family 2 protein [Olivibacter sp. XZL3]|uniref:glycosyltransferase n=1 Tax=Olivibacter sp. XZL3 TaxID=1735116 RepID=UPI001064B00A|nr:glycosyltransferase [Olivibacter sp. XZL3]